MSLSMEFRPICGGIAKEKVHSLAIFTFTVDIFYICICVSNFV